MSNWGNDSEDDPDPHMRVYEDKFEFVDEDGNVVDYEIGTQTQQARDRYQRIKRELENGYLTDLIDTVTDVEADIEIDLDEPHKETIDTIVDAIGSEKGRATAGLSTVQLAIKSIAPEQSVRLHKGSNNSAHFSWKEGLSMRTIDSSYIAPALREYDLLRVNKDGVMMTRSLAENYPYSRFYQANIRGAQDAWADLIEELEDPESTIDPEEAATWLLSTLSGAMLQRHTADYDVVTPVRTMLHGYVDEFARASSHTDHGDRPDDGADASRE